jgi:hypothetical protein
VVRKNLFFYKPDEDIADGADAVSANDVRTLYLKPEYGTQAFYELALFTQEASSQGVGSPSNSGQSNGFKNPPLQTLSGPGNGIAIQ